MILDELNLVLSKVNKKNDFFDVFIETGSFEGLTLNEVKNEFNSIFSIEITEKYSELCKRKFLNNKNITIIHGDSLIELPKLINSSKNNKILFYLDAHYSAGDTGKNELDVPLIQELGLISDMCENYCLIIIDDADLFEFTDKYLSWEGINEVNILNSLKDRVGDYFYLDNITPKGKKRLIIELKNK